MTVGVFVAVGVGVGVGVADSGVVGSASSGGGGSELSTSDTLPVTLAQRSLTASCTPPASDHTIQTMMAIAMPLSTQGTLFIIHRRRFLRLERHEGEDEALRIETPCRRSVVHWMRCRPADADHASSGASWPYCTMLRKGVVLRFFEVLPLDYLLTNPVPPGKSRTIFPFGCALWIPVYAGMTAVGSSSISCSVPLPML